MHQLDQGCPVFLGGRCWFICTGSEQTHVGGWSTFCKGYGLWVGGTAPYMGSPTAKLSLFSLRGGVSPTKPGLKIHDGNLLVGLLVHAVIALPQSLPLV